MDPAFQLLEEPWIRVHSKGALEEVSLLEVFARADQLNGLAGELATQDVAMLRLLLAVMYGAARERLPANSTYQDAIDFWYFLWEKGRFDEDFVIPYLQAHRERFWLFHPTHPFFQVADLTTNKQLDKNISQLIADVPSRSERRFFSNLSGTALSSLPYAEAARWLIHLQAWDYAGKKASVIGGSADGGGTGWCGKLGVVFAEGNNLFETLLYNFVLISNHQPIKITSPFWEKPAKTAAKEQIEPQSYVDLLVCQSRRVRLLCEEDRVTGVISSYGDVFDKENRQLLEQMSGWHLSAQKGQGYLPTTHQANRSIWRDLGPLFLQNDKSTRPPLMDWISYDLDIQEVVKLSAVGYEYGAMMGVVNTMVADSLQLNARLLGEFGEDWRLDIIDLLGKTDQAVRILGFLASDLAESVGSRDAKSAAHAPKEQAYYALDEPFRHWLRSIDPLATERHDTLERWAKTASRIIRTLGAELISLAGEQAMVGREVGKEDKKRRINAAIAQRKFHFAFKKQIGW